MRNLKLTPTGKLTELQWQSLRQSFVDRGMIGGSDAGTLLGWNKWKSPLNMFYQAIGLGGLPTQMNIEMAMGKMQEDNIADCWQYWGGTDESFIQNIITKTKVRRYKKVKSIIENPKYPLLFANVDGIITSHPERGKKKGILEIKKINGMTVDSYETGIPPQYIAQVQHYMLVADLKYAELCMRVDGRQLKVHLLEQDKEVQEAILHHAHEFNRRVSAAKVELAKSSGDKEEMFGIAAQFEPDIDGSDDAEAFISQKHKSRELEGEMQGDDELFKHAVEYVTANAMIKASESVKQNAGNILKQAMEKNAAVVMNLPDGKITWRKQFQVRLNKN